jgi:hypothetical protein
MIHDPVNGHDQPRTVRLFRCLDIPSLSLAFAAAILISNSAVRFIRARWFEFDCPTYWPLSIFWFRTPRWKQVLFAVALGVALHFIMICLSRVKWVLPYVVLIGMALLLGTTAIQGWVRGFELPITGVWKPGFEYYHDAIQIKDALSFLRDYEQVQPNLLVHSRTHPPGAVLSIYLLLKVLGKPAFASVAIAVVSVCLSCLLLYRIVAAAFGANGFAGYVTLLFMLMPAVQIYYLASIDALIASLLLGVLYLSLFAKPSVWATLGSVFFLFLASSLTFGFVFVVLVLVGFELIRCQGVRRSGTALLGLVLIYLLVYRFCGFNYLHSFAIASADQNPQGFRLLVEPANYFFTRLEGIAEIALFLGPFLAALMARGLRMTRKPRSDLLLLAWLGISTLLVMLLAGVFPTGETARACLFVQPFLIFPIAVYLRETGASDKDQAVLLHLVFTQTLLMQTFGTFAW